MSSDSIPNDHLAGSDAELDTKPAPVAAVGSFAVEKYAVIENVDEGRFELHHDGEILSIADYSERDSGVIIVPHVGTDPQHRGQGNAGRLMHGVLGRLRASDRTIIPVCPFAASHIQQNPEYQDLLAT